MRPFEDGRLLLVVIVRVGLCKGRVPSIEVLHGSHDIILDPFEQGVDERRANVLEATFDPHVVVKEIALAGQHTEADGERVVLAVYDRYEAGSHLLRDVEHARQVHELLIVLAQFAYGPNEKRLIQLEHLLQDG